MGVARTDGRKEGGSTAQSNHAEAENSGEQSARGEGAGRRAEECEVPDDRFAAEGNRKLRQ
eukprot:3488728-Heterocapsa_arctica.AAC.1